jgi:hypothetical protein
MVIIIRILLFDDVDSILRRLFAKQDQKLITHLKKVSTERKIRKYTFLIQLYITYEV